jgi:hypothetical protein
MTGLPNLWPIGGMLPVNMFSVPTYIYSNSVLLYNICFVSTVGMWRNLSL